MSENSFVLHHPWDPELLRLRIGYICVRSAAVLSVASEKQLDFPESPNIPFAIPSHIA